MKKNLTGLDEVMALLSIQTSASAISPITEFVRQTSQSARPPSGGVFVAGPDGAAAAGGSSQAGSIQSALQQLTSQLAQVRDSQQNNLASVLENTKELANNTGALGLAKTSPLGTVAGLAGNLLGGGGLSISPLLTGLLGLFGLGGSSETVTPLARYAAPPSIQSAAGVQGAASYVTPVDYSQGGVPRAATATSSTQVTVQVNAMDSRSFLDHSDEIAQAVRRAMLNSSSLNDVVVDL